MFIVHGLLPHRTFGYGHSFGALSHYYGREAGLELREDIDTVLEPGMVVSMEPMITVMEGEPGAGGYREHDILVVGEDGAENITKFPFGPEHNIIDYTTYLLLEKMAPRTLLSSHSVQNITSLTPKLDLVRS